MKRLLLVSAAFVAMLPMTALARGRGCICWAGICALRLVWLWLVWSLRHVRTVRRHSERGEGKTGY